MLPAGSAASLSPWEPGLLAMLTYGAMVFALMAVLLFLCSWLGEKKVNKEKDLAYESGVIPTGPAILRSPAAFYLVAVFFLIFDVEGAFIFSWAIALRDLGWWGWFEIVFFIAVLLLSLIYIWMKNGLDWRPQGAKKRHGPH